MAQTQRSKNIVLFALFESQLNNLLAPKIFEIIRGATRFELAPAEALEATPELETLLTAIRGLTSSTGSTLEAILAVQIAAAPFLKAQREIEH
ncbi:MAG: hypothetical protein WC505_06235 [Patescibacteria group bacterium]